MACEVIPPTLIPRKPGERVKTNRRDAGKLAHCYRAGELTAVWVPDADHEALRDLVRAREAAKKDQLRARHRLNKFPAAARPTAGRGRQGLDEAIPRMGARQGELRTAGEIQWLKSEISVERLVESFGVKLKRHWANLVGRCPFHDDGMPSLNVTPKTKLWSCKGACNVDGPTIDWVMKTQGLASALPSSC